MITALIGAILALLGLVGYLFQRKATSDALLKNNDVKDQLNSIDGQIAQNQGQIDAAKAELERKKNEEVTKDGLVDFLKRNSPK